MPTMIRTRIQPGDGDRRHGTYNGYRNLACRCDDCRAAATNYHWLHGDAGYATDACPECGGPKRKPSRTCRDCFNRSRMALCGTETSYKNGCRCDLCRSASTEDRRLRRQKMSDEQRAIVAERDKIRMRKRRA